MERPQGSWQPPQRQVTGEILHIQDQWQRGEQSSAYMDLPEEIRQQLENNAQLQQASGEQPEILAMYEAYDAAPSELSLSCRALAEELLALGGSGDMSQSALALPLEAEEVVAKLKATRIGSLLTDDDEQLALPPGSMYSRPSDIRKSIMTLQDAALRIWHQEGRRYVEPSDTTVARSIGHLPYPAGEKSHTFTIDLSFKYKTADGTTVTEIIALNIDRTGGLHLFRTVDMPAYELAERQNHKSKSLENASDADVASFADFIADVVGDSPETLEQRENRLFLEAIMRVPREDSRTLLEDWAARIGTTGARLQTRALTDRHGVSFFDQLSDPEKSDAAHARLEAKISRSRRG